MTLVASYCFLRNIELHIKQRIALVKHLATW